MIIQANILEAINKHASDFNVSSALIKAICQIESGFVPWRARYEHTWKHFYLPGSYAKTLGITLETETMFQSTSIGLMQVMGGVARELGFDSHLTQLILPDYGIKYGTKKLSLLMKKYSNIKDVIASYNAGMPTTDSSGLYKNQKYVDAVSKACALYQLEVIQNG